jgi:hypothetical protein
MAEVSELEGLLPDMAAKIEDSRDQMTTSVEVEKIVEDEESRESEVANKIHNSPSKTVTNINHLVKRKRTTEEGNTSNGTIAEESEPTCKKLAFETNDIPTSSSSNGNGDVK